MEEEKIWEDESLKSILELAGATFWEEIGRYARIKYNQGRKLCQRCQRETYVEKRKTNKNQRLPNTLDEYKFREKQLYGLKSLMKE